MPRKYISLLCFLLGLLFYTGCQKPAEPITKTAFYFDTMIQITLYDNTEEALIDDCFQMAAAYEQLLSRTAAGSDIDQICILRYHSIAGKGDFLLCAQRRRL